jgi:hypothetical protein
MRSTQRYFKPSEVKRPGFRGRCSNAARNPDHRVAQFFFPCADAALRARPAEKFFGQFPFAALALPKADHCARISSKRLARAQAHGRLAGEKIGVGWRYESEVQIDFYDFLTAARGIQRIA